jgi:hypothetical protein
MVLSSVDRPIINHKEKEKDLFSSQNKMIFFLVHLTLKWFLIKKKRQKDKNFFFSPCTSTKQKRLFSVINEKWFCFFCFFFCFFPVYCGSVFVFGLSYRRILNDSPNDISNNYRYFSEKLRIFEDFWGFLRITSSEDFWGFLRILFED